MKKITENISRLLKEQGKTQMALADFIGVRRSTVNGWVKDRQEPRAYLIPGIAKFLDVPIERLFEGVS